ncbi:MAG: DUF3025 domain-containing protein [Roseateles depolymerans]|uniref:DUF3025 domain-containing protein n=1 Tax=Roseateles depolymerans TaxID=76731 RepID=A0A2W5E489_9BURK|nr:MAG: DUF3025 domain-containing protein [Roseateles depolymerans]
MPLPADFIAAPWCAPLRPAWAALGEGRSVAQRLDASPLAPRRFVEQQALPSGQAYEAFIATRGCVPTRDNAHDLLNGLVWCAEPALKSRLNALQAAAIARDGVQPRRGALRDALTLFDESGACWPDCPPEIAAAWRRRDWHAMFITHRTLWARSRPRLVGHALLEQLAGAPRKGLCAHVLLADPLTLDEVAWAAKPFLPLPVLGVPGWWPANELPGFYEDDRVFRPIRLASAPAYGGIICAHPS